MSRKERKRLSFGGKVKRAELAPVHAAELARVCHRQVHPLRSL
jgi:hypothetical protein